MGPTICGLIAGSRVTRHMNRKAILFVSCWCAAAHAAIAQEVPPEITNPEEREILGLAIKLSRVSLAYRAIAAEKLLTEANYLSKQLQLPIQYPILPSNANIWIRGPWGSKTDSTNMHLSKADRIRAASFFASGVVAADKFTFGLGGPDNRVNVKRVRIKDEGSILDLYPELARTPSLTDTNGAYQLATQWLTAISVDVAELERKHKVGFFQHFFWGNLEDLPKDQWTYRPPTSTNKTMLPIFDVNWGDGDTPGVKVTILGCTKELLELQINDASFYRRPLLIITNAIELNSRPDPPVKRLDRAVQEPHTNSAVSNRASPQMPPPFRRQIKKP